MQSLRAVSHPFRSPLAPRCTLTERSKGWKSSKYCYLASGGRIKESTWTKDGLSLAGERRTNERTNDDEPSVAKGGGRLRRPPRRALTLGAPPARRTHACLRGRVRVAREDGFGCASASAEYTCTIIIPLQQRPNFWIFAIFSEHFIFLIVTSCISAMNQRMGGDKRGLNRSQLFLL